MSSGRSEKMALGEEWSEPGSSCSSSHHRPTEPTPQEREDSSGLQRGGGSLCKESEHRQSESASWWKLEWWGGAGLVRTPSGGAALSQRHAQAARPRLRSVAG